MTTFFVHVSTVRVVEVEAESPDAAARLYYDHPGRYRESDPIDGSIDAVTESGMPDSDDLRNPQPCSACGGDTPPYTGDGSVTCGPCFIDQWKRRSR